jgi:hypothetical protein
MNSTRISLVASFKRRRLVGWRALLIPADCEMTARCCLDNGNKHRPLEYAVLPAIRSAALPFAVPSLRRSTLGVRQHKTGNARGRFSRDACPDNTSNDMDAIQRQSVFFSRLMEFSMTGWDWKSSSMIVLPSRSVVIFVAIDILPSPSPFEPLCISISVNR